MSTKNKANWIVAYLLNVINAKKWAAGNEELRRGRIRADKQRKIDPLEYQNNSGQKHFLQTYFKM